MNYRLLIQMVMPSWLTSLSSSPPTLPYLLLKCFRILHQNHLQCAHPTYPLSLSWMTTLWIAPIKTLLFRPTV